MADVSVLSTKQSRLIINKAGSNRISHSWLRGCGDRP